LLPHRFPTAAAGDGLCPELAGFVEEFRQVNRLLMDLQPSRKSNACVPSAAAETAAWEVLVRRAVIGASEFEDAYEPFASEAREKARNAVESLMRGLEFWSLDLQRHCPEDWNQFSAVLVECLSGGSQKQQRTNLFQV